MTAYSCRSDVFLALEKEESTEPCELSSSLDSCCSPSSRSALCICSHRHSVDRVGTDMRSLHTRTLQTKASVRWNGSLLLGGTNGFVPGLFLSHVLWTGCSPTESSRGQREDTVSIAKGKTGRSSPSTVYRGTRNHTFKRSGNTREASTVRKPCLLGVTVISLINRRDLQKMSSKISEELSRNLLFKSELRQLTASIQSYLDTTVRTVVTPLIESNQQLTKRVEELEKKVCELQNQQHSSVC